MKQSWLKLEKVTPSHTPITAITEGDWAPAVYGDRLYVRRFSLVGEIVKHEAEFPRACGISFLGLVKRSELCPASSSFNKAECPSTAQGPIERQGGFYFTAFQTYICKSKAHCILWAKRADQKTPRERIYRHPGFETKQNKNKHIHGGIHLGKHPAACAPKSSQGSHWRVRAEGAKGERASYLLYPSYVSVLPSCFPASMVYLYSL